ncbi:ABC transporter ATP-binding protein [Nonomuraea jabiensis]|uniref:Peptide/nickel transport system ATP-binding protein n=1 Tax=Nonomuraea jabiensis TaxID=882448 RepID=A0A7W9GG55_9ACTN|nr:ABC transporter ATP-binding protein [Nonomuraea jabiensis]MBB5783212.1 peptide/nickel transport system ATP-binding protein [Nonomuraea jabiensis]
MSGGEELLRITDLRVSYRSGPAVEGVDLVVGEGEIVAVVGESGSGKSTTAHAVLGLLPAGGRISGGRVLFRGEDLTLAGHRRMRQIRGREIGLVPQDPMVSLNPVTRVGTQVAETLLVHGLAERRQARERAVELLGEVGLPDAAACARRYPHELSGGMRQRVLIAVALAAGPRLLIADEPTSALDVTVQRQILDHLTTLTRRSGTAVLLVTHDLALAAERAGRVVVLHEGRSVESGTAARILRAPDHPYTRRLIANAPSLAPPPPRPAAPAPDEPLLSVEGVTKVFGAPGEAVVAVDDVTLSVRRGETLALVGESGSGKSTLALMALCLLPPTRGRIVFDGDDVAAGGRGGLRRFRRRVQPVFQDPYSSLDPRRSVGDSVAEPLRAFGVDDRAGRRARVAELLDRVALPASVARRRPAELSGGQRQRVAIARALALGAELVVCDEPVSALDVTVQAQVLDLLTDLQAELGLSYLFISHDLAVVRQIADRVAVMRSGRIVESGPAADVLREPRHAYTRTLLDAVPVPAQPTIEEPA